MKSGREMAAISRPNPCQVPVETSNLCRPVVSTERKCVNLLAFTAFPSRPVYAAAAFVASKQTREAQSPQKTRMWWWCKPKNSRQQLNYCPAPKIRKSWTQTMSIVDSVSILWLMWYCRTLTAKKVAGRKMAEISAIVIIDLVSLVDCSVSLFISLFSLMPCSVSFCIS